MSDLYKAQFFSAANDWVYDSYSIDIRYVAKKNGGKYELLGASINLAPLPATEDLSFCVETAELYAGLTQLPKQGKRVLLDILNSATLGHLDVNGHPLTLASDKPYSYSAELFSGTDRWFSELHLQIISNLDIRPNPSYIETTRIDNSLRKCSPPFDGMTDLTGWLGLKDILNSHSAPSINVRVLPPVDLIYPKCSLDENVLELVLNAHPQFDVSRLTLAVLAVPGISIASRKQVTSNIKWKRARGGRREGVARISLKQADSALVMVSIGDMTVRRQWFLDAAKSSNNRLTATQLFDKDLRMIKQAVLEPTDSTRFEYGLAALLFLMGFSPAVQLETQAPDIIVTTPNGRIILIECTTRIADFSTKLGKLVDRKGALIRSLADSNNYSNVDAVLVCALPRDQIAARPDELKLHQIILVAKEELVSTLEQVRFHPDPDKFIEDAIAKQAMSQEGPASHYFSQS